MKTLISCFIVVLAAAWMQQALAQSLSSGAKSVSLQPIFWLDSLVPAQLTGFSVQY